MKQEIKKEYQRPVLRTTEIKLGVFGTYGTDDGCDNQHRHRHGHQGGGGGGDWGWGWGSGD